MGRTVVIGDTQQVSAEIYYFALDPGHASYAATEAALATSLSDKIAALTAQGTTTALLERSNIQQHGTYEVADGGNGYTGLKICGPCYGANGLTIDGSLCLDIVNYSKCINPNYTTGVRTLRTNEWGDQYYLYGQFLRAPQRLPTTGYDRLISHMKGEGSDSTLWIAKTARGDGSGDSYVNACAVKDCLSINNAGTAAKSPQTKSILVLCGSLSRLRNEGVTDYTSYIGLEIKSGTAGSRTQILAHPVDGAHVFGGSQLGMGNADPATNSQGEDADWSDEGDGTWKINVGSDVIESTPILESRHIFTNEGGTIRPRTHSYTLADCVATSDSYFIPKKRAGHRNTTRAYVPGDTIVYKNVVYYCWASHTNQAPPEPTSDQLAFATAPNKNDYWVQEGFWLFWDGAVSYPAGAVVSTGGVFYVAKQASVNKNPTTETAYWAIKIALATYNASCTYAKGEVALSGGTYWIAKRSNSGVSPSEGDDWTATPQVFVNSSTNPKTHTFFFHAWPGVQIFFRNKEYVDIYGVHFYTKAFLQYFENFTFYACKFWGTGFSADTAGVNEATGAFIYTPDPAENRAWIGCEWEYGGPAVYDINAGSRINPINTIIKDCYMHQFNKFDINGANNVSSSDQHAIAAQGCDGLYITNCRFDDVGAQTIIVYCAGQNFDEPTGGLESTEGYVDGFGWPTYTYDMGGGTYGCSGLCRNFQVRHCLATNINTAEVDDIYYTGEFFISLHGDPPLFGYADCYSGILFEHNIIEGAFNNGAFRIKYQFEDGETDIPIIRNNKIRGAKIGLRAFTTLELPGPVTYDPSFQFYNNDVHVEGDAGSGYPTFVSIDATANPDHHIQLLHNNIYRNDGGGRWVGAGGVHTTLAAWQAAVQTGDDHDTNSTHVALGA